MFIVLERGREGEQKEWRSESEVTTKKAKVLSVLIVFRYWGDGILWLSVDFHYKVKGSQGFCFNRDSPVKKEENNS